MFSNKLKFLRRWGPVKSLYVLLKEPPVRIFSRFVVKRFSASVRTRARWDAAERPNYLVGVLAAADQAVAQELDGITVLEFGVSGGSGLLALEQVAADVQRETGVQIDVFGFDTGSGLPVSCGDYRDHPDRWAENDYATDLDALRSRLQDSTTLLLGNVSDTVPEFVRSIQRYPLGFASVDVDYYSSTRDCLRVFTIPGKHTLRRTFLYFDDVALPCSHRFAGELLAIEEFNNGQENVKIDRWRSLAAGRAFFEAAWLDGMYQAHDLAAISQVRPTREPTNYLSLGEESLA